MKIATWNINSVRLRLPLLKLLNEQENPDIIALQETKTIDDFFPYDAIRQIGYEHIVFTGQKSYNGVAILSKHPIDTSFSLDLYNDDKRHIACRISDYEIHNFYIPAGGDIPDMNVNPKFKHKIEYVKLIQNWFKTNNHHTNKRILLGDLNIAPFEHDVWSSRQLRDVVSHTQIERETLLALKDSINFIDTARHFIDMEEKLYTWWSYRNRDWQKSNRGRRLDHIWVSQDMAEHMQNVKSLTEARNWDKPSDHVPFILTLNSKFAL